MTSFVVRRHNYPPSVATMLRQAEERNATPAKATPAKKAAKKTAAKQAKK